MLLSSSPPSARLKTCWRIFPAWRDRCLRLLFAFLYRVSLCSTDNKMTTENLGIVFAPNLLRGPNATEINVLDLQVREEPGKGEGRGGGG